MLMHVVTLKWRSDVTQQQIEGLHEALARMPSLVPELLDYRHGPDLGLRPGTGDYAIVATLARREDLPAYLDHPEHKKIAEEFTNVMSEVRLPVQIEVAEPKGA